MNVCLSRPFLILCGILYLGFGLSVLLAPAAGMEAVFGAAAGAFEGLGGSHGGLNAAAGLFLIHAAFSGPWRRPGLWLVALMNAGYLAGRALALAMGGVLSAPLVAVMVLEAALCGSALAMVLPEGHLRARTRTHPRTRTD